MVTKPAGKGPKAKRGPAKPSPAGPTSGCDFAAIEEFCSDLAYEEIPFESWQKSLDNLDLTVPLWLSSEMARRGGDIPVSFCRMVRDAPTDSPRREAATWLLAVPPASRSGDLLAVLGQGDRIADTNGDLIVVIKIKS